ncbi:hypothetical protein GCM10018790_09160 [Kitasatospora xanthocidica]|uniref:hypothetical protein n=1 Tax=Kitasatospora xanthocidica TaxID=83382 RepID=UPI00167B87C2|nr:hypothetical protein [Kitasatospora xanthocidica]GHF33678.1 hypothetical protein GCM10018790_09160 [Kitasatospora xanthocidica]
MPFAETPLRDEYAAAVERVAGRTLDALRGGGGAAALADPDTAVPRPLLAAVRVLGADLFAPHLLTGTEPDGPTAALLAEARRVFPTPAAATPEAALAIAWQDWAAGQVLARTPYADTASAPTPAAPPGPAELGWQLWSVRMSQLSALALPGLDGPVHDAARTDTLGLARGTVRSMLRRDFTTAVRLARWLAWAGAEDRPPRLEVAPILERIHLVGIGAVRTRLELVVAERLLEGTPK